MESLIARFGVQNGTNFSAPLYSSSTYRRNLKHSCNSVRFRRVRPAPAISLYTSSCYNFFRPSPALASLSPSVVPAPEADYGSIVSPSIEFTDPPKRVHIKFVLQKICLFGQHILIVGDNPKLGLWDPTKAVPLNWSEGHIWTTELDLPANETVKFKFVLKGLSGQLNWQSGQDRILETWDTTKTIIVTEEWDNAGHQMTTEEDVSDNQVEDPAIKNEKDNIVLVKQTTIFDRQDVIGLTGANASQSMNFEKNLTVDEGNLRLAPGSTFAFASGNTLDISGKSTSANATFGYAPSKDYNFVQLLEKKEKYEATEENLQLEEPEKVIQVNGVDKELHNNVSKFETKEADNKPTANSLKDEVHWVAKLLNTFSSVWSLT